MTRISKNAIMNEISNKSVIIKNYEVRTLTDKNGSPYYLLIDKSGIVEDIYLIFSNNVGQEKIDELIKNEGSDNHYEIVFNENNYKDRISKKVVDIILVI